MATKYIVNNVSGQTINGQQLQPYKVYTALLTQSGGDGPSNINEGLLTIGVTYEIGDESPGWDFTNVGAPNNIPGTKFVATGTTPNSWGSMEGNPGITILIFNTGAPIATVLENTIGNIWFTYQGVGNYNVNSDGLFFLDKTYTVLQLIGDDSGSSPRRVGSVNQISNSALIFYNCDLTGTPLNGITDLSSIEIRVYN